MTAVSRRSLTKSLLALSSVTICGIPVRLEAAGAASSSDQTYRNNADFHFILLGDSPYSTLLEPALAKVLSEASAGASFTIHVGDIKSGRESCSNEFLLRRVKLLNSSPIPLIYLPGDNEWVDCRQTDESPFDATNRLEFIRREVFSNQYSLGVKKLTTQHQTDYSEHRQWQHNGIQFITLNIPGSFNGIGVLPQSAIDARMRAAITWLEAGVSQAIEQNCQGLVVALHANIGVNSSGFRPLAGKSALAYGEFRKVFLAQCKRWAKPCLLLHGDSHQFSNDKPSEALPLLQRVESFGFPFTSSWARINVVHQNPALFVVSANHL
jgi:hypothetical protein